MRLKCLNIEKADIIQNTRYTSFEQNDKIEVRRICAENVFDGKEFNTEEEIDTFKQFIEQGHIGYYAYYEGVCACRVWVLTNKDRCLVGDGFIYDLKENEYFVAWVYTHNEYRGLGLYPYILKYALASHPNIIFKAHTDTNNKKALNAVKKAGFETVARYILILVFNRGIKIKVLNSKGRRCFFPSIGRLIKLK